MKIKTTLIILAGATLFASCKYKEIVNPTATSQQVYMPTAAITPTINNSVVNAYLINTVATPGLTYRYQVDLTGSRFNVPLSVYRSGLDNKGDINVSIAMRPDTVTRMIANGKLTGVILLPADKYTVAGSVNIVNGSEIGLFNLSVDLNYLLANIGNIYAIGVTINSTQVPLVSKLNTTVVVIDTKMLVPVANFTGAADASNSKLIKFTNTSANAVGYSWDFGDGTAAVTDTAPSHTYASSGTYNVNLKATGVAGSQNASTLVKTVVIP